MPNKPIKQGYKIFALAEHGYLWTFFWSSRQLGIIKMFKYPTLTTTGLIIINIIERFLSNNLYSIYMDNYFILIPLF